MVTHRHTDRQTDMQNIDPAQNTVLGWVKIRKFAENKQTNRKTDRQTNKQRIQIQRPLLSPVDRRGERANRQKEDAVKFCRKSAEEE